MQKSLFRFKQFSVANDLSAMKVGTDGVLLGAWCSIGPHGAAILDVGSGSGLISLMLAQRNPSANVTGIEIDAAAANESRQNVADSPFATRITIVNDDFFQWSLHYSAKYDIIVSNPPFFSESILPPDARRSLARHSANFPMNRFFECAARLIANDGIISLINPYSEKSNLIAAAFDAGFYPLRITEVRTTPSRQPRRILIEFSRNRAVHTLTSSLILQTAPNSPTPEYIALTSPFYLDK